jgi:peptide/nickel transport system ATP-binding protein
MDDIAMPLPGAAILSIRNLEVHFAQDEGLVRAVDGASFDLHPGKILGIVGESGCGKSVTARAVLQILDRPGRIVGGEIWFDRPGAPPLDIAHVDSASPAMAEIRGKEIALIFQEPMTSFSAHYTIGNQISEVITLHEPDSARSSCCAWSAFRGPSDASTSTRSSCPADSGSAP